MLSFRSTRKTEDVDIAVSKEALYEFDSAAANNSRFKKQSGGLREYTSNTGIIVKFDFVPVGGALAPKFKVVEALPGSNKVRVERREDKDATHSIRIMENVGTNLGELTEEEEYVEDFAKLLSGPVKQRFWALQI
ncbi:hypothetical protein ABVK25_002436 [Lepraria finkii]|uniref:Uncharacterized protein n=1 Tax=Lepraria finkii TaxID=1340010 RepID=A0ABR4BN58_9LECA